MSAHHPTGHLGADPAVFSACRNGPCEHGRKLCPTPEACLVAERAEAAREPVRLLLLAAVLVLLAVVLALALGAAT